METVKGLVVARTQGGTNRADTFSGQRHYSVGTTMVGTCHYMFTKTHGVCDPKCDLYSKRWALAGDMSLWLLACD